MTHSLPKGAALARAQPSGTAALALVAVVLVLTGCGDSDRSKQAETSAEAASESKTLTGPKGREWRKLAYDGLHDPANDMLEYLQEPATALGTLPSGGPEGNKVDWMGALEDGYIEPRTNIYPETEVRVLDLDIVFDNTAGEAHVVFPHRQHTEWMDCSNCHPKIFKAKKGANDFGMLDVLQGRYCGQCHGAVAFPLTQCARCHSGKRVREGSE